MAIYTQTSWSLADLFSARDGQDMQQAFATLESGVASFETRRAELTVEIAEADFLTIIRELEALNRLAQRIYDFASLSFAADTQDQGAQTFLAQVRQIMAGFENRTLFFSLWWKALDDEPAERLLSKSGDYRYWLEQMRNFKPHTLSEAEEKIVNIKNTTGASALNTLYAAITNRYVFRLEVDGEIKEMTRGEAMVYVRQADPELAQSGLPGDVPGLRAGWTGVGTDLPDAGAGLAQRAGGPAPLLRSDGGAQPGERYPGPGGRYAAGGLPEQRRYLPALFPLEGALAGDAAPAPV